MAFGGTGELWSALLDVATSLNRAVISYAEPQQAKAILEHPIYHILLESLAGMQELMAVERIDHALADGFEEIFIDTAPSRHAFEFVDKPEFFAELSVTQKRRVRGRPPDGKGREPQPPEREEGVSHLVAPFHGDPGVYRAYHCRS